MQVFVKYQLFTFHTDIIKNISLQSSGNCLAFSGGLESSTLQILPYSIPQNYSSPEIKDKLIFTPPNKNSIFKKSISLLKWSPNDLYLASACETLLIFHSISSENGPNFIEFKNYKDHPLEITALAWSPDSLRIASSSLSHRIIIRDLTSSDDIIEKVLNLDIKVLGLVWDPLDKYLMGLCADNKLIVWKTKSFEVFKTINLSFSPKPGIEFFHSKREDRKIDWSPDYKYVLSPSLDDKIVPVVCALDRQDFEVKFTFMGPFSSINCIKFNPILFEKSGIVISVFAMGDNDGNISVWGLGDKLINDKPFFLFKSHSNGNELIEDLGWNSQGNLLMATTMKKYVSCILFDEEIFGKPLKNDDAIDYKRGLFGDRLFNKEKMRVFQGVNNNEFRLEKNLKDNIGVFEEGFKINLNQNSLGNENLKTVFTEQKVVVENGKKKIIPQMQKLVEEKEEKKRNLIEIEDDGAISEENIKKKEKKLSNEDKKGKSDPKEKSIELIIKDNFEKTEKALEKPIKINEKPIKIIQKTENLLTKKPEILEKPNDRISPLKKKILKPKTVDSKLLLAERTKERPQTPIKSIESISNPLQISRIAIPDFFITAISAEKSLEFEKRLNEKTRIRCILTRNLLKEILWTDYLEGEILLFEYNSCFLCFYTSKSLLFLINAVSGRRAEYPLFIHELILMKLNEKNELLMIKSDGNLRILNIQRKNEVLMENIMSLVKENIENFPEFKEFPIENVFFDKESMPFITFKPKQSFFFNFELKNWQKIDFEDLEIGGFENSALNRKTLATNKRKNIENIEVFFKKLGENQENSSDFEEKALNIAKLEEKLIFYMNRNEWKGFEIAIKRYLTKLIEEKEIHKIKQIFADLFIEENKGEFMFLRKNVKEIKGFYKELVGFLMGFRGMEEIVKEILQYVELSRVFIE